MAKQPNEATRLVPRQAAAAVGGDAEVAVGAGAGKEITLRAEFKKVFLEKKALKVLLVGVPIAMLANTLHLSNGVAFLAAFLGLVPLAALLGDFTEDLAKRSNDVIGALINVTFGNATELIISIVALRHGMLDVIKLSLIGSVLGNMLLVLGTAFMYAGSKHKDLTFNSDAVNTYGPLLLLSMLSFAIPAIYTQVHMNDAARRGTGTPDTVLRISRELAVVMCVTYVAYLVFQLVTHRHLFEEDKAAQQLYVEGEQGEGEEDDEDDEDPEFSWNFGFAGLAVASVLIAYLSDILVGTLQEAAEQWSVPKQFIGIILVPIVGNAAEHASAIVMAGRNKLDIAVGVALGSSIQIAMFVMPVLVVVGWIFGAPLDLNFHPFLTGTTVLSVLVATNAVQDGKTNWLEGWMLLACYIMIAIVFLHGTIEITPSG